MAQPKDMTGLGGLPQIDFTPPTDPTRVVDDPVNPPDQSIYSNPVANNQTRRSPISSQVGFNPNLNK